MVSSASRDSNLLRLLRQQDAQRTWGSLDDERVCVLCGREFRGRDIRIAIENGRATCHCPTRGCRGALSHFVFAGNPLVDQVTFDDWMLALEEEAAAEEQHS